MSQRAGGANVSHATCLLNSALLFFYILRHLSRYMDQTCQKVMGATTFSLCPFLIGFFRFLLAGGLLISGLTD
jgi:hypothetical protein